MAKDKIIYVYDPMCGWCFGFGKVMSEFHQLNKDAFEFDVISGGMVVGDREGPIGDFADYILGAYKRVEEYSGMKFGQPYLDQLKTKTLWSSSVKPAIAVETFKAFNTKDIVAFSHAVQKAYFIEGKDLRDENVYKELIKPYQINEADFIKKLNSDEMRTRTSDWFKTSADWGITGYPAVLMVRNGKYYAIARGFTDLETLNKNVQSVVSAN
ncbi:MAG: DsbA family protein [Bacteroidota bacterium]